MFPLTIVAFCILIHHSDSSSWFSRTSRAAKQPRIHTEPGMVNIAGGKFIMGIRDREARNGEAPPYQSAVKPFRLDKYLVTNEDFLRFRVAKQHYQTEAEAHGWSHVFEGHLHQETIMLFQHHDPDHKEPHMIPIMGASWSTPYGPDSNISKVLNHPVVHVSKRDAQSFCFWKQKRLPSEYEWEFAARGGLRNAQYPWGDTYKAGRVNVWQGKYPHNDTAADGYRGTSPINAYPEQNKFGIHDMVGNVWEWTSTKYHFRHIPQEPDYYVVKGGSYLDSRKGQVNYKARTSTRNGRLLYYTAGNLGFRCAKSAPDLPKITNYEMSQHKKGPQTTEAKISMIHSEL